jgi:hypothetical protein
MLAQESPPLKRKETEKDLIVEITADIERHHMPPLFGVKYFEVDIEYWDSSFIKNHVYNQMSAAEKEEYKTVMKQSFALELLGACGYHCFKHDGKRKFLWGHLYASKWAYRLASKKNIKFDDGQRKYNVLMDGNADKYDLHYHQDLALAGLHYALRPTCRLDRCRGPAVQRRPALLVGVSWGGGCGARRLREDIAGPCPGYSSDHRAAVTNREHGLCG